jgi:glycosyl hydrolase family 108/predicted peptidoglycan binding protein
MARSRRLRAIPAITAMGAQRAMSDFTPAFDYLMSHEDAHAHAWLTGHDPAQAEKMGKVTVDSGGRTRFGIAEKFHPSLHKDFFSMPASDALAQAEIIYRAEYWGPMRLGELLNQAVASKIFDMGVNMGRNPAALLAQRAANGLLLGRSLAPPIDGKIGSRTLSALNACPAAALIETLSNLSKIFYSDLAAKKPENKKYLEGWLKRAAAAPPGVALSSQQSAMPDRDIESSVHRTIGSSGHHPTAPQPSAPGSPSAKEER